MVSQRCRRFALAWIFALGMTSAMAFTLHMEYKPPVKRSVGKLHNDRFGKSERTRGDSSSTRDNHPSRTSRSRSTTSKSAYAGALAAPAPTPRQSFEDRMRDIVFGKKTEKKQKKYNDIKSMTRRHKMKLPQNVQVIESLNEYKKVVADEKQKMVIVRFYAPWCRACKAVAPAFYHMAKGNPNAIFVDVPVTEENSNLHQGLGVDRLPFCHIYHPKAGLVEELRFTRQHFREVSKIFKSYLTRECSDIEIDADTNMFSSPYKKTSE